MDHCPKAAGMLMMLRTMTPEILAADEIGGEKDIKAMAYVRNCNIVISDSTWKFDAGYFCTPGIGGIFKISFLNDMYF